MSVLDLLEGVRVIVGCHGDVAAIKNSRPRIERVGLERYIVASVKVQATRALTDTRGSEARAGTIRCANVKGRANEGKVVLYVFLRQALYVWQTSKGRDSREH